MESLYRAVASTTLKGLDTAPDSDAGMLFTVVLLFCGVAVFFYTAGDVVDVITRGVFGDVFGERRRRWREIDELSDHVIICGHGRDGRTVAAECTGALIVALRKPDDSFGVTPGPGALLVEGEIVVGVGSAEEMHRLEDVFAPREAPVG